MREPEIIQKRKRKDSGGVRGGVGRDLTQGAWSAKNPTEIV